MNPPSAGASREAFASAPFHEGTTREAILTSTDEPKVTRTLMRGLRVLECFADPDGGVGLSLTDVAGRTGIDKATALRLLSTYCVAGYLRRDEASHRYSLTARILRLSQGISWYQAVIEHARPHLVSLRDEVGEVVHLGVMEEGRVVYIDKLEADQPVKLVSAVGQDMPMNTTALGKAIMTHLVLERGESIDRFSSKFEVRTSRSLVTHETLLHELRLTRERSYSVDDNENQYGVVCVGAPIFGRSGPPVAALSVSGPEFRMRDRVEEVGLRGRRAADAISNDLGGLNSSPKRDSHAGH